MHAGAVIVPAVLAACERHNPDGRMALIGHRGRHRSSLPVEPRGAEGRAQGRLSPDRDLRRDGGGGRRRRRARPQRQADRRRARHRRQHGRRHHRISRRGRLDQAAACGLGGAIGPSRRAIGAAGLCRSAHGVRGRAWAVPRFRPYDPRRLRRADRRFRHALGDGHAGVQALSLRDHGAALHRLRAAAGRARRQGRGHQRDRLRGGGGDGAPAVGAACRQAAPAQRLCRQVRDAVSAGDRFRPWRGRARRIHGSRDRATRACSRLRPR